MLDLGMFAAMQSLQQKVAARNTEELVNAVVKAYNDYPPQHVEDNFLSLQKCMESTMSVHGDNTYKLPHMKKAHHRASGKTISTVVCSREVYSLAVNSLSGGLN